jgi:hypothetical protein
MRRLQPMFALEAKSGGGLAPSAAEQPIGVGIKHLFNDVGIFLAPQCSVVGTIGVDLVSGHDADEDPDG